MRFQFGGLYENVPPLFHAIRRSVDLCKGSLSKQLSRKELTSHQITTIFYHTLHREASISITNLSHYYELCYNILMKKVIIKCRLKSRDQFEDRLSSIDLDFGAIYWQHDRVYVPRSYKPGVNYPRLVMRTTMRAVDEPPVYSMILRRHIEDSGIDIIEETPVSDYSGAANIILQLGFRQAGEISRRRQDLVMKEGTMIYLDEIDGRTGIYAKIEAALTDADHVSDIKSDLQKTLETLGETDIVEKSYFEL